MAAGHAPGICPRRRAAQNGGL